MSTLLTIISENLVIYIGILILIFGIFGNIMNLIVFLSLKTFRENSCAFYLIIMSIANIGQLIASLLTRLIINLTGIDWSINSIFYCKFRWYFVHICALVSFSCICLATIDQYLATCSHIQWQKYNHIKYTRRFSLILTCFWLIYEIPSLIIYNHIYSSITKRITCSMTNLIYQKYNTFAYILTLTGILPICITIFFGLLAYKNIQQIPYRTIPLVRRELDKQLTLMVLIHIFFNFFDITPFTIVIVYTHLVGTNTPETQFISNIATCLYYSYFACSFYIYILTSKRFRLQLKYVLSKRVQQIAPIGI